MSDYPYTPDIKQVGRDALLSVWQGDRVDAILEAIANGFQDLEDETHNLQTSLDFELAVDDWLNIWGRMLDEPRGGLNNSRYRRVLVAKMLLLNRRGTISDILDIVSEATDTDAEVKSVAPAYYSIEIERADSLSESTVSRTKRFVSYVSPAGVGYEITEGETDMFRLDEPALDTNGLGRNL